MLFGPVVQLLVSSFRQPGFKLVLGWMISYRSCFLRGVEVGWG